MPRSMCNSAPTHSDQSVDRTARRSGLRSVVVGALAVSLRTLRPAGHPIRVRESITALHGMPEDAPELAVVGRACAILGVFPVARCVLVCPFILQKIGRSLVPAQRDVTLALLIGEAFPQRKQVVLHQAAGFDAARLIVVSLSCGSGAMAEQTGGYADMRGILDRDAGGGAIAKQVRVDWLAKSLAGAGNDPGVAAVVGHRLSIHGQPQSISQGARTEVPQRYDASPVIHEIYLEMRHQHFGPRSLDRFLCFRLVSRDLDPPPPASSDKGAAEDEAGQVSQPQRTTRQQRDHQSVAVGLESPQPRSLILGPSHQVDPEI